ncbi:MAG: glycosyltransferase family 2 protein [Candidatus Taylorbacteria bacterium]
MSKTISIVIPVFNEEENIPLILGELSTVMSKLAQPTALGGGYKHEIIFVDDGSTDGSADVIKKLCDSNSNISYLEFSRNFGKEMSITAGLNHCKGDCAIIIDADLQHPTSVIPSFISEWEKGYEVVVGIRRKSKSDCLTKIIGSKLFYGIMSRISEIEFIPNSTDFLLMDRKVIYAFNQCTERTRITRGLIAWLGFRRSLVEFDASERRTGKAGYSYAKLLRLALSSFVAMSLFPLKVAGYLGILITAVAGLLGIFILTDRFFLHNFFAFTWLATLTVINIFLIGIVLSCLGLIALYIAAISKDVSNRPMYVIRESKKSQQN